MDYKNKLLEIIHRISEKVSKRHNYGRYDYIFWIVKRYLRYAIEAAINGYTIKVYNRYPIAKIELVWIPAEIMKKRKRKHFQFSNKIFGQMFYLSITGKYFKNELYNFFLNPGIKRRIQEKLDSDDIYQFVKS